MPDSEQVWDRINQEVAALLGDEEAQRAFRQLLRVIGEETVKDIVAKCHASIGGKPIETPQDLLEFGTALADVGGFIGIVGRSFRIACLSKGATLDPETTEAMVKSLQPGSQEG